MSIGITKRSTFDFSYYLNYLLCCCSRIMSRYNTYTPGTDHVDQLFSAFILKLSNCIKHILLQC